MIPFFRPHVTGRELAYVQEAIASRQWNGNGPFTGRCVEALRALTGRLCLLTPSGTHALELAMMSLGLEPGSEVLVPSYTFVSTATCLLHVGLTPVFVDVREDTLNIDERRLEEGLSEKTRAILPVHYAGVAADMDAIGAFARQHRLKVVEDAAHGLFAYYKDRALGAIGDLGVFSFHATKNYTCGEGGAVVIGDEALRDEVEVHREVGTNRALFLQGKIPHYSWVDRGSNYLLADLLAAFLLAQLEASETIRAERRRVYEAYLEALRPLEKAGIIRLPVIPAECRSNYHFFHFLVDTEKTRDALREHLRRDGIQAAAHYLPLHRSRGGERFGRTPGPLPVAESISGRLLRLPLYPEMTAGDQDLVIRSVRSYFGR